ncbi:mitochondrial inner membrane protein OXA1L-like [Leptopilina heterotoma]|uniref:mitochondrial inner membrane protein OXA1L-like n=1 Tax=Leptopilina heterotoma TaxID=63436 RepID=UPI001CA9EBF0|nr:mitochondrial inner membrane protein OXA1L-like [Leptopilina heterotoma]
MLSRMSFSVAAQNVTKSQSFIKFQNKTTNRSLHLICRTRILPAPNIFKSKTNVELNFIRHASKKEIVDTFGFIPEAPMPETIIEPEVAEKISEIASAGLGSYWTPVGCVQNTLEFLHSTLEIPWWASIIALTVVVRLACFPLVIKAQKATAELSKYLPEILNIQDKITRARKAGDKEAVERYAIELHRAVNGKELIPFKPFVPSVIQGSLALSVFLALQGMAKVPLKSMEEGGIFWFTNLCVNDPYYILPLMSCATLTLLLKSSLNTMPMDKITKKLFIFVMPIGILFFIKSFPASTLVYWVTTNSVTLLQHHVLKIPSVKNYYGLPSFENTEKNVVSPGNFLESLHSNVENMKVTQQFNERIYLQNMEKTKYKRQQTKVPEQKKMKR